MNIRENGGVYNILWCRGSFGCKVRPGESRVSDRMIWMSDLGSNGFAEKRQEWVNPLDADLSQDKDMVMEQILDNINHTPLGQVLKKIASMPDVRRKKVLQLRRQITEGKYDVADRLDMALDKVLEDLIA